MSDIDTDVYFSYNVNIINKNIGGNKKYFSEGWENVCVPLSALITLISNGVAYCAVMNNETRNKNNFAGTNIVSIDIDAENTISAVLDHEFAQKHLSALYTTVNHTAQFHRFRILFRLERIIEDADEYEILMRTLRLMFKGDRSAIDAARIFFGNNQSTPQEWDRFIPNDVIDRLLLLNPEPKSDKNSDYQSLASSRSKVCIPLDQLITTADNQQIKFKDINPRTSIYCPYHLDENPSAFVGINERLSKFIHCTSCKTSWWQEGFQTHPTKSEAFKFENILKQISQMDIDQYKEHLRPHITESDLINLNKANISFVNQKFIQLSEINAGITFIKSPKGSGKTESLVEIIENLVRKRNLLTLAVFEDNEDPDYPPDSWDTGKRVLLIGHRRALIRNLCERLELNCYLEDQNTDVPTKGPRRLNRYGICLDSIKKISNNFSFEKYDLVIIDESEQVLSHFLSDTIDDKNGVFAAFRNIIQSTKQVIALDADLGWLSFLTLTKMRSKSKKDSKKENKNDVKIIINEYVPERGEVQIFNLKAELMTDLFSNIKKGNKIFVSSNSKKHISRLCELIKENDADIKYFSITSSNSGEKSVVDFIENYKTEIPKYDVILASPTIGTGVDITFDNDERVFDYVYGFYESQVNTHYEMDQQLSRVRHPRNVKVWVTSQTFFYETNFHVIKSDFLLHNLIANTAFDSTNRVADLVFNEDNESFSDGKNEFLTMAATSLSEARDSKNNLRSNFLDYKEKTGWTIKSIHDKTNDGSRTHGNKLLARAKKLDEIAYTKKLMNAKPIDQDKFLELQDDIVAEEKLSESNYWSFQRTKIELFYCVPINENIIKDDNHRSLRNQYFYYCKIINDHDTDHQTITHESMTPEYLNKYYSVFRNSNESLYLLKQLFISANIFADSCFITDTEFSTKSLLTFTKKVIEWKSMLETQFPKVSIRSDVHKKPTSQLQSFLKLVGIKMINTRNKRTSNGGKLYLYQIDVKSIELMEKLRSLDVQRENQWAELNNRYGFSPKMESSWG